MPELVLRELDEADAERLADFFEQNNIAAVVRHFSPFPLTRSTARALLVRPHLDHHFGAYDRGGLVGFAMLRGWDEGYETPSFGILVDHRRQGQGIGRRVVEWTLAEAQRLGVRRVRLSVYYSNTSAYRLYRSVGFIEAFGEAIIVGGEPDKKIVMFKDLP